MGLRPPKVLKSQPQTRDCHLVFRGCDSDEVMRVGAEPGIPCLQERGHPDRGVLQGRAM